MNKKILILGGYGVFGQKIAIALAKEEDITVIIAGRNLIDAEKFAKSICVEAIQIDTSFNFDNILHNLNPHIIINCCGPFQDNNYNIAINCIKRNIHYIDLADAREYVNNFTILDDLAKKHKTIAITGASTVPALSSAILDYFLKTEFTEIHSIDYGVTPSNRTPRGTATVSAILSYVGKPFTTLIDGKIQKIYGWQNLHQEKYPDIGTRWMSNCDIPDIDLFHKFYPTLRNIRFYAGLELPILHLGLWLCSWLVRIKIIKNLKPYAKLLRHISLWFYKFGTSHGGMHIKLKGINHKGEYKNKTWYILAYDGDGPQIPAVISIILAKKIINKQLDITGAYVALGILSRDEILNELKKYHIKEVII